MKTTDPLITVVPIPDVEEKIHYRDAVSLIGSCFAEHMGDKMDRYKYNVLVNPFGILYNPVSMAKSLERIGRKSYYHPDEFVLQDGLYHSMDHHGSFSGKDIDAIVQRINDAIHLAHEHVSKSTSVFISPGTSIVYRYKPTGEIAGNCHKIPQTSFERLFLNVNECAIAFKKIRHAILSLSPNARIIWTVSPVRHLRDGLVQNQQSKSTLILAIDQEIKEHGGSLYFPAYEIMMDQLRDYRFYARDLIHPSEVAIDMIWDLFSAAYLDPGERKWHVAIDQIKRAMEHRWHHHDPDAVKTFARGQLKNIDQLAEMLPEINWRQERQHFFQLTELD